MQSEEQTKSGRKDDTGKARFDLIPWGAIEGLVAVLTFGAKKYQPNGWRTVPDALPRYEAALLRHFAAYKRGEEVDPESGLPHLHHALTNLVFIVELTKGSK